MRKLPFLALTLAPVAIFGAQAQTLGADAIARCLAPGANMSTCSVSRGASFGMAASSAAPARPRPSVQASSTGHAAPVNGTGAAIRASVPAAPPPSEARSEGAGIGVDLTVQFANGSADLTPAGMKSLDELGKALREPSLQDYRFRIEGHTDTVGNRDSNRSLSGRRAEAVVRYLESRYTIASNRLTPAGLGQDQLLVPTSDNVAEPRNRRVQVVNIGR